MDKLFISASDLYEDVEVFQPGLHVHPVLYSNEQHAYHTDSGGTEVLLVIGDW